METDTFCEKIYTGVGGGTHIWKGFGGVAVMTPGFFQAILRSLAYQFTVNAPLLCLPFSCFRNFSHFQPCFGQNSISLDPNFSRKIRSLNPTSWNPRGTHPPEKKLSALPGRYKPTKGPFTNTCKGGLIQKIFIAKIVRPPLSDSKKKKKIRAPPFLPWKLRVNAVEKHINSIFNGKSVVIFSGPLPCKGQNF